MDIRPIQGGSEGKEITILKSRLASRTPPSVSPQPPEASPFPPPPAAGADGGCRASSAATSPAAGTEQQGAGGWGGPEGGGRGTRTQSGQETAAWGGPRAGAQARRGGDLPHDLILPSRSPATTAPGSTLHRNATAAGATPRGQVLGVALAREPRGRRTRNREAGTRFPLGWGQTFSAHKLPRGSLPSLKAAIWSEAP